MKGQVIWALGELGIRDASDSIKGLLNDRRETWIYENDCIRVREIGDIAKEALDKMCFSRQ